MTMIHPTSDKKLFKFSGELPKGYDYKLFTTPKGMFIAGIAPTQEPIYYRILDDKLIKIKSKNTF